MSKRRKVLKFKQYRHQIKQSKLEKWHLNVKQIATVYSYKTKKEQQDVAKRLKSSVKASRAKKFYETGLGQWIINKKIQRLTDKARALDKKTNQKDIDKLAKQINKWEMKLLNAKIRSASTRQAKEDLIAQKQHKIDRIRARINAGERAYFIHNTKEENYRKNDTTNVKLREYLEEHYPGAVDALMEGQQDEDGNWIVEPMSEEDALREMIEQAMKDGLLEPLMQGEGFGYIDKTNKEVVSPV